jgi:hypothetical protein
MYKQIYTSSYLPEHDETCLMILLLLLLQERYFCSIQLNIKKLVGTR